MPRFCINRSVIVLVALLLGPAARLGHAQNVKYSILLGAGHTSWDGPYTRKGGFDPLLAGIMEARVTKPLAARVELGTRTYTADMGNTGFLSSPTTLVLNRLHLATLGRVYAPMRVGRPRLFVELGAAAWYRTICDVDTAGVIFSDETVDCDQWESDSSGVARPLRPNSSGTNVVVGIGGYAGRFGLTLRYETAGRAVVETDEGPVHARAFILAAEWVFNGRQ